MLHFWRFMIKEKQLKPVDSMGFSTFFWLAVLISSHQPLCEGKRDRVRHAQGLGPRQEELLRHREGHASEGEAEVRRVRGDVRQESRCQGHKAPRFPPLVCLKSPRQGLIRQSRRPLGRGHRKDGSGRLFAAPVTQRKKDVTKDFFDGMNSQSQTGGCV